MNEKFSYTKKIIYIIINILFSLMINISYSYSFDFSLNLNKSAKQVSLPLPNDDDYLKMNIYFDFLGQKNTREYQGYSNNDDLFQQSNVCIKLKINLSMNDFLR